MRSLSLLAAAGLLLLLATSIANAVPVGTQVLTINALDSVSGEVIDSSTTGVVPLEIPAPYNLSVTRTPDSVLLDLPGPELQEYFGVSFYSPFGSGSGSIENLEVFVQCSTGSTCGGQPPPPGLVRLDFEASNQFGFLQMRRSQYDISVNGYGRLTILGSGDVLEKHNLKITLDIEIMARLFDLNCLRDDCSFQVDVVNDDGLTSGWQVVYSPEPGTAVPFCCRAIRTFYASSARREAESTTFIAHGEDTVTTTTGGAKVRNIGLVAGSYAQRTSFDEETRFAINLHGIQLKLTVPEPGTTLVVGVGARGILVWRRG